jgi:hypothetical protein
MATRDEISQNSTAGARISEKPSGVPRSISAPNPPTQSARAVTDTTISCSGNNKIGNTKLCLKSYGTALVRPPIGMVMVFANV